MNQDQPQNQREQPQQLFAERYRTGNIPWDTGISPPELMAILTGPEAIPPGRALDIGCGTGTNSLELARHGWPVLGVDFAEEAIAQAKRKAEQASEAITQAGGSVDFLCADVTLLAPPPADQRYNLLFDLGCLNGIPFTLRPAYAEMVNTSAAPGALFLLYAHLPNPERQGPLGCTPEEIDELFGAHFILEQRVFGDSPQGGGSMWTWLRRRDTEQRS